MMLKLAGTAPERAASVRLEDGIPFGVDLAPQVGSIDDILYWRSANGTYLLEVKVVAASGMIGGVELILVPADRRRMVQSVLQVGPRTDTGIPVVDLAPWKARIGNREFFDPALRYVDERVPFVFAIGSDGIAVYFESGEAASAVKSGDLGFSFTEEGVLCGITVTGLSAREIRRMRKLHGP
jgi:hypothetical protein